MSCIHEIDGVAIVDVQLGCTGEKDAKGDNAVSLRPATFDGGLVENMESWAGKPQDGTKSCQSKAYGHVVVAIVTQNMTPVIHRLTLPCQTDPAAIK